MYTCKQVYINKIDMTRCLHPHHSRATTEAASIKAPGKPRADARP
jgi:hypothetical protein